jgi:hypothetical protein
MVAALFAAGAVERIASAQKLQTNPRTQGSLAQGEDQTKALLLLADTEKTSKVSEKEFIRFMEAEFKRLDQNKSGEIDTKALAQSQLQVIPSVSARKHCYKLFFPGSPFTNDLTRHFLKSQPVRT